jgi:hypothetical protein
VPIPQREAVHVFFFTTEVPGHWIALHVLNPGKYERLISRNSENSHSVQSGRCAENRRHRLAREAPLRLQQNAVNFLALAASNSLYSLDSSAVFPFPNL